MIVGAIREVKDGENRVGLSPLSVVELVKAGASVLVERGAGRGVGFSDDEYVRAGAEIVKDAISVVRRVDLLVKVKEPIESEYFLLDEFKEKVLFTYLHLAAAPKELTLRLIRNNITVIAYETVEDEKGRLPLLMPMSEIAGVLAVQYGAQYLQKKYNGRGLTLGRIQNAVSAKVVVVGSGVVGSKAALTAAGMGCSVTVLEKNVARIEQLKKEFESYLGKELYSNVSFFESTKENTDSQIKEADLLIGAVLVKGMKAPQVISKEQIVSMKNGAVIVDVAIDQGGCIWGSRPTTHEDPMYMLEGKIYCCVANMPGQVALQSTQALTSSTLPYLIKMVKFGVIDYLKKDLFFARGLNVYNGGIVYKGVADALNLPYNKINL